MRRVYQRVSTLAVTLTVLVASFGCSPSSTPSSDPPAPRSAIDEIPTALVLAGRSYGLPNRGATGSALAATETGPDSIRVVAIADLPAGRPRFLTPIGLDCRAMAVHPVSHRLAADCIHRASGAAGLRLFDSRRSLQEASPAAPGQVFLAWSADGAAAWTASAPGAGRPARLNAIDASGRRRTVFDAPPGFAVVAYSPSSDRALLHRSLHAEAHEVVLHDGRSASSRLLLPTHADGRFTELFFAADGGDILLLADDGGDTPRLERLDLTSGERAPFGSLPCPPAGLRRHADDSTTVILDCEGRPRAVRLDADGGETALPLVVAGTRIVDWMPSPSGEGFVLVTAGEQWPEAIGVTRANGDYQPLTYGLAGRIRPAALPAPRPWRWSSAGITLPAEIWPASGAPAKAVVVWIGDADRTLRLGIHRPLLAALALRHVTVVGIRGRGDEWPSRRLRRAADGDPAAAAWADLRSAHAATADLAATGAPRLLVAEGSWWAAAALALATATDAPFDSTLALYPSLDPLAEVLAAAAAVEPLRSRLLERWGEPGEASLLRRREEWRFPVERVRRPVFLALDPQAPEHAAGLERVTAAAATGVPVDALTAPRRMASERLSGELERELIARLLAAANRASR